MMRWSDLAAGLRASGPLLLRAAFWGTVLRRALFSRVALGYMVLAVALGAVAWGAWPTRVGSHAAGALALGMLVLMPVLLVVAACLLLPYLCWVFNPAVAQHIPDHLALPEPEPYEEPPFGSYVRWSLPTIGWLLLSVVATLFGRGLQYPVLFFAALSLVKLLVRASLAPHYAPQTIARFLAATTGERVLVWLPLLLLAGWTTDAARGALEAALSWPFHRMGFPTAGWLVSLALDVIVSSFLTAALVGALMLACGRLVEPNAPAGEDTQPLPGPAPERVPASRPDAAPAHRGRSAALLAAGLVLAGAGAWLGRFHLTDLYFARDAEYREAVQRHVPGLYPPGDGAEPDARWRLQAGLILYACAGRLDRANWLWRLGVHEGLDLGGVVACAACDLRRPTLEWVDAKAPGTQVNTVIHRERDQTGLSCAAQSDNLTLARTLKARGADPSLPRGHASAMNIAIERGNPQMLRLMLEGASPALVTQAFDTAARQRPQLLRELAAIVGPGIALARDREGRNVLHLAGMQNDLALAGAVPDSASLREQPDEQGAQPWMHVLRRAQLDGQPVNLTLLQALLPPGADVNARVRVGHMPQALPAGWSAAQAVLNDPGARVVLGAALDYGWLPADRARWWQFRDEEAATAFLHDLTPAQLIRAEQPEAPPGHTAQPLSAALSERGWTKLAESVRATAQRARR